MIKQAEAGWEKHHASHPYGVADPSRVEFVGGSFFDGGDGEQEETASSSNCQSRKEGKGSRRCAKGAAVSRSSSFRQGQGPPAHLK